MRERRFNCPGCNTELIANVEKKEFNCYSCGLAIQLNDDFFKPVTTDEMIKDLKQKRAEYYNNRVLGGIIVLFSIIFMIIMISISPIIGIVAFGLLCVMGTSIILYSNNKIKFYNNEIQKLIDSKEDK